MVRQRVGRWGDLGSNRGSTWQGEASQKFQGTRHQFVISLIRQLLHIQTHDVTRHLEKKSPSDSLSTFALSPDFSIFNYPNQTAPRHNTCTMNMPDMPVNVPVDDPNADTEW